MINVTLEELLEAGAHFGHQARRWNPKMDEYLYGIKDGVHIFDLVKTKEALDEALAVLEKYVKEDKTILLVGTKKQAKDRVAEVGKNAKVFYINERWLGGTLSNFETVHASVRKLADFKEGLSSGKFNVLTKKERLLKQREVEKLEKNFGGISGMDKKPDLIVIIDSHRETGAVKEAKMLKIPTIAIVDSNADPAVVTYAIPMNDDASKSLEFILTVFEKVIMAAKGLKMEKKAEPKKEEKKTTKKTVKVEDKAEEFAIAE